MHRERKNKEWAFYYIYTTKHIAGIKVQIKPWKKLQKYKINDKNDNTNVPKCCITNHLKVIKNENITKNINKNIIPFTAHLRRK
jgi:hypothetical protein